MLLIPPPLVECLACFDGEQTELDLRASLVQATGDIQVGELEKHLFETLSGAGFLEDEAFEQIRCAADARVRRSAAVQRRTPARLIPKSPRRRARSSTGYMQNMPVYAEDSLLGHCRAAREPVRRRGILPRRVCRADP